MLNKQTSVHTTAEVAQGKVRGRTTDGVTAFLGIPYAATPTGRALFEAPGPPPSWDGTRDATGYGPTAPQSNYNPPFDSMLENPRIEGQEFLNLNVWTPEVSDTALPVMVWIHGGSFRFGSNSPSMYDGSRFARDGVVLVSINYRLGAPGFALLDDAPANRGLLDQLAALQWVQRNIAAFGGDPTKVTVFGESAGAICIAMLLASPLRVGLFDRAIIQSGNGFVCADPQDAQSYAGELARRLGVEPTAEGFAAADVVDLITAQRQLDLDLAADPDQARWGSIVTRGRGLAGFMPVVDGTVVPAVPQEMLEAGDAADVALLIGTTTEEMRFFLVPTGVTASLPAEKLPRLLSAIGVDPALAGAYGSNRPTATPGDIFAAIFTDLAFIVPSTHIAEGHAAAGSETYLYQFSWRATDHDLGAAHALELPYVFDTLGSDGAPMLFGDQVPPQDLADTMHRAWVDFAHGHSPGWERYDSKRRPVMNFDSPSRLTFDPRADELAFWR